MTLFILVLNFSSGDLWSSRKEFIYKELFARYIKLNKKVDFIFMKGHTFNKERVSFIEIVVGTVNQVVRFYFEEEALCLHYVIRLTTSYYYQIILRNYSILIIYIFLLMSINGTALYLCYIF